MIKSLPSNLRHIFEKHGIEADDLSFDESSLVVDFDDIEVAFEVREKVLNLYSCCLINKNKKPALLIHDLLTHKQ